MPAVHEVTIGASGSGKSYYLVHKLVTDWLPAEHNGTFYTNLPVNLEEITIYILEKHPELVSSRVMERLHLIPKEEFNNWMSEKSHPMDYFNGKDLCGGRICLDEFHNLVHKKSSKEWIHKWQQWLGELRHCQCTFEAVSQYETKIHPLVRNECALIRRLKPLDELRDKVFRIRYYDYLQLISKMKGFYYSLISYTEWLPEAEGKMSWKKQAECVLPLVPSYYKLYNSYSAPHHQQGKAVIRNPHPFQLMGWSQLIWWFLARNIARITCMLMIYGFVVYAGFWLLNGGIINLFTHVHKNTPIKGSGETAVIAQDHNAPTTTTSSPSLASIIPLSRPAIPAIWSRRGTFLANGQPYTLVQVAIPGVNEVPDSAHALYDSLYPRMPAEDSSHRSPDTVGVHASAAAQGPGSSVEHSTTSGSQSSVSVPRSSSTGNSHAGFNFGRIP